MTEKIIHFLWLDFKNKKDGNLNDKLKFFKSRIESLHQSADWTINYVDNYNKCYDNIDAGNSWLQDLLNNEYVSPAHKSDALRYYYLYNQGGVWIDISTFLLEPLDKLVENNKNGFTCYYMPSDIFSSWITKLSSDIFENVSVKEYNMELIPLQHKLTKIKNPKFDFISENYFIISKKGNEVCKNVFDQLKKFWTNALPHIKNEEDCCYQLDNLMYTLITDVYNINLDNFPFLHLINYENINILVKKKILKEYFNCSYFFNYLQLYKAIRDVSIENRGTLNVKKINHFRNNTIKNERLINSSTYICNPNNCNDKVIRFSDNNFNINLLSASFNRLTKYSDNREERISWENTIAGNILNEVKSASEALEKFNEIDITQLKYSSYTRDKSKSVPRLMELFQHNISLIYKPHTMEASHIPSQLIMSNSSSRAKSAKSAESAESAKSAKSAKGGKSKKLLRKY